MFSIGVDIVQVKRIEKLMEKRTEQFYGKIFTEKEILYIYERSSNPKTVAGLFSAKEAIVKALGTGIGRISWLDIEIIHDDYGKPLVNKSDKLNTILLERGKKSIDISISHEEDYAIAFAICF